MDNNTTPTIVAIEFECETGYRFWELCKEADIEACINYHADMGYSLSDIDDTDSTGHVWTPPKGARLVGPVNPTEGPGWSFTYARAA